MESSLLKKYDEIRDELISSLEKGTQVAFFGQQLIDTSDAMRHELEALGAGDVSNIYDWWLASSKPADDRAKVVKNSCDSIIVSDELQAVCNWPWTTVFTSSIDAVLSRSLEVPDTRLVTQIVGTSYSASASTASLPLVRLFGTVERNLLDEMPPVSARELRSRRTIAIELLGNIPGLIASNGSFFVDGWTPDQDWLRARDISTGLSTLAPGQVYIFGLGERDSELLTQDEDISDLIDDGIITLVGKSLSEVFSNLIKEEVLPERPDSTLVSKQVVYEVARSAPRKKEDEVVLNDVVPVIFDRLEWRAIMGDFLEINDIVVADDLPKDPQLRYKEFRKLTANGPTSSNIQWILRLAYKRPIVDELLSRCIEIAGKEVPQEFYLMLKGQSGSGKTIALAQLAVELRKRGFPVLYVPTTMLPINRQRVEQFCDRVSGESSAPVFLLYDGTQDISEYYSLTQYFSSRGRKCVVVGSAYTFHEQGKGKTDSGAKRGKTAVIKEYSCHLSVKIEEDEQEGLLQHLYQFVEASNVDLKSMLEVGIDHFFATIYRALPHVRGPLEEGFLAECASGACKLEERVEEIVNSDEADQRKFSVMEQALRAALGDRMDQLVSGKETDSTDSSSTGGAVPTASSKARQLIDVVMLVSRYCLQLPQSIALRMLNNNISAYRGAFTGGLLGEHKIKSNEYAIAARHPVEADIWVRRHLRDRESQWEIINSIGRYVDHANINEDYSVETEFLIQLFRVIGPQGPSQWSWKPGFVHIARFIENLRKSAGYISPRLQLVEAHSARESVLFEQSVQSDVDEAINFDRAFGILDSAENGLRDAFEKVQDSAENRLTPGHRKMLGILETERACVLGTKIGTLKRSRSIDELVEPSMQGRLDQWWNSARDAWRSALRWNDENSMATDAACWICDERLSSGMKSASKMADVLAEWREALDRYELFDLSLDQIGKRESRNAEYLHKIGDIEGEEETLKCLSELPEPSAQVLYVRFLEQKSGPEVAFDYLENRFGADVFHKHILMFPLLRLWWRKNTQYESFFPGERISLGVTTAEWEKLLEICNAWRVFEPENSLALYMSAIALLHLGDGAETMRTIRTLDRLGVGGAKRSRSLLAYSDSAGDPIAMSAIFKGNWRGRFALAWCDKIGAEVEFSPEEFGYPDIRVGTVIEPFYLAISFRSLRADLTRRYAKKSRS
jgi:hypothetical protein